MKTLTEYMAGWNSHSKEMLGDRFFERVVVRSRYGKKLHFGSTGSAVAVCGVRAAGRVDPSQVSKDAVLCDKCFWHFKYGK